MSRRLKIILLLVIFVSAAVGLYKKQSYTNITAEPNMMDHFTVAQLDIGMISDDFGEILKEELLNSNIIIRARATGEIIHHYRLNEQYGEVLEVYRGDNHVDIGDEIGIISPGWLFFFDDMSANMGFINFMEEGEEYLLFIEEKVDTLDPLDNTYVVVDAIVSPVFSYKDKDNIIAKTEGEISYVPFSEVSQNEFFVNSNEVLDMLMGLKHDLIEEFPQ